MPASEQVCILYAGVRGYLDKLTTSDIAEFETLYMAHLKSKHAHVIEAIHSEGALSDASDAALKAILEDFMPNCGLKLKA